MNAFDPRPTLARALDQAGDLIASTPLDLANRPTPDAEWTVGELIDHLQAVVRRIAAVLGGKPFDSVPRSIASTNWAQDWGQGRAAVDEVLADGSFLSRQVTVPWGEVDGASAAASYIGELSVHSWDLAVATDRGDQLDPALAAAALPATRAKIPAEPRGGQVPFGPVVEVAEDAGPYEQLVAWAGRDPHWTATATA